MSVTENFFGTWNFETGTPDRVANGNICTNDDGNVWPLIKYDWSCSYTTEKDCTSKFIFYETEIANHFFIQDQRKAVAAPDGCPEYSWWGWSDAECTKAF